MNPKSHFSSCPFYFKTYYEKNSSIMWQMISCVIPMDKKKQILYRKAFSYQSKVAVIEEGFAKMIKILFFSLFLGKTFGKFVHVKCQTKYDIIKDLVINCEKFVHVPQCYICC